MTSAKELYEKEPEYITHDLSVISEHINEADIPEMYELVWNYPGQIAERIDICILKHFDFDYKPSFWQLATVWFDGNPVMICQNAGRKGGDYTARFITDRDKFFEMCKYIHILFASRFDPSEKYKEIKIIDANETRTDLLKFYGNSLTDRFERY